MIVVIDNGEKDRETGTHDELAWPRRSMRRLNMMQFRKAEQDDAAAVYLKADETVS